MSRTFDPTLSKSTELAGRRIDENQITLRIGNCVVRETLVEWLRRRDVLNPGILWDLLQSREIRCTICQRRNFPDVFRKLPEEDGSVADVLGKRRRGGGDGQRGARSPVENSSQLPL